MTAASWLDRSRGNLRRLSGRTPIRVKIITALLTLVIIALAIISTASLTQFRGYLQNQSGTQVTALYDQMEAKTQQQSLFGLGSRGGWNAMDFGSYGPYLVELVNQSGKVVFPSGPGPGNVPTSSAGPAVPTSSAWLTANAGHLTTVPGQNGTADWQVIAKQFTVSLTNALGQSSSPQKLTLVVGTSLANIDNTVAWLAKIDLLVSVIIVIALAVLGVAIVRASLRPLTDIEKTAQAIAAGDLSRRVPDQDPRTEVGRLGRSLNRMLAQIESSFQARTRSEAAARRSEERMRQFVADASHELRTPLTAMRGYAEYYRQRGGVGDDPAQPAEAGHGTAAAAGPAALPGGPGAVGAEAALNGTGQLSGPDLDRIMQRVEQESARMGVLVEDMLLLARLDQQRPLERRPVDLLTLAADAVQDARIIAPDRSIELSVGSATAFLVLGDEVRLRQVIGNLMSNALTHTPDGTPVTVRILAGPREPVASIVLEVTDQGPGLPPEQAERVFERFYRADQARTRKAGGTGLGLAIVAALVAAHGGSVALRTAPGEGATFRVTLPLAPEAQRDEPMDAADEDEDVLATGDGTTPPGSPGGQPPEPPAPDPRSAPSGGMRRS
jgi:two-component system OmpR family sensor kinase